MYNWSVDEEKFKKEDPNGYEIWRLEQMINYGLGGSKLDLTELKKYWNEIKIDPARKRFLTLILDEK